MKVWVLGGACALAMALMACPAWAQCGSRGGTGGGMGAPTGGGTSVATAAASAGGQLLTSPGSWAYDMLLQARMRQAYEQQQSALAEQRAAEAAELKARRQANWQQRRSSERARRQERRELALVASTRSR